MTTRRWYHPNLSGEEAESLLLERGMDGSFLCRPSGSNKNDYTLSVRRGQFVTHIKIQNHGNYFDLCGGEAFPTLTEIIKYYMDNGLHEKNGDLIELKYPMNSKDPTSERWFHGNMSAKEAERLLIDKGKIGSFLVRESTRKLGDFVLTIRTDEGFTHVMIRHIKGKLDVGGGILFNSLADLINYYIQNPMVEKNGGTVVHLKQPLNATKVTASSIGERLSALQKDVSTIVEGKDGFWEEYEQLQQQECKHLYSRNAAKKNKNKNRFKNIGPFDHTRVVLHDDPTNDYINASFIDGENEHDYIATQGCLPDTIVDFMRMLDQERSTIILMVSKEVERGKSRCSRYWPDLNKTLTFDHFEITNIKETDTQEFISRELKLINTNTPDVEPLIIYQYQYIVWPEHGNPSNVGSVLGILHDITLKLKAQDSPGPMVVHDGSGIGRTGAIIVIDILMKILQKQGFDCEIDIQKTVQLVRDQRPGMVQLEAQYKFIYLAIAHYVSMENELRSISPQRVSSGRRRSEPMKRVPPTPTHQHFSQRPPLPPPVISINGESIPSIPVPPLSAPPVPARIPGAGGSGLPEGVLVGRPLPREEPPLPNTPPPIPPRKK